MYEVRLTIKHKDLPSPFRRKLEMRHFGDCSGPEDWTQGLDIRLPKWEFLEQSCTKQDL